MLLKRLSSCRRIDWGCQSQNPRLHFADKDNLNTVMDEININFASKAAYIMATLNVVQFVL